MKLNVEIYQDQEFLEKAKGLILNRINQIIRDETTLQKLVEEIVEKYTKRNVIKKMVDQKVADIVKHTEFDHTNKRGFYTKTHSLNEYIKKRINTTIESIVKQKLECYTIDIKKED